MFFYYNIRRPCLFFHRCILYIVYRLWFTNFENFEFWEFLNLCLFHFPFWNNQDRGNTEISELENVLIFKNVGAKRPKNCFVQFSNCTIFSKTGEASAFNKSQHRLICMGATTLLDKQIEFLLFIIFFLVFILQIFFSKRKSRVVRFYV